MRGLTPHAGVHVPSEPVSEYIYIYIYIYICMKLAVFDDNDRTHMANASFTSDTFWT